MRPDWAGRARCRSATPLVRQPHDTHFPHTHDGIGDPDLLHASRERDHACDNHDSLCRDLREHRWANVDRAIGQVLAIVRAGSARRDAEIVVTSDHARSFPARRSVSFGHGYALNDAQTRVPFVVINLLMVVPEPLVQSEIRPAPYGRTCRSIDETRRQRLRPRGPAPVLRDLGDLKPRKWGSLVLTAGLGGDSAGRRGASSEAGWLQAGQPAESR